MIWNMELSLHNRRFRKRLVSHWPNVLNCTCRIINLSNCRITPSLFSRSTFLTWLEKHRRSAITAEFVVNTTDGSIHAKAVEKSTISSVSKISEMWNRHIWSKMPLVSSVDRCAMKLFLSIGTLFQAGLVRSAKIFEDSSPPMISLKPMYSLDLRVLSSTVFNLRHGSNRWILHRRSISRVTSLVVYRPHPRSVYRRMNLMIVWEWFSSKVLLWHHSPTRLKASRTYLNSIADISSNRLTQADLLILDVSIKLLNTSPELLVSSLSSFEVYRLSQLFLFLSSTDQQYITYERFSELFSAYLLAATSELDSQETYFRKSWSPFWLIRQRRLRTW